MKFEDGSTVTVKLETGKTKCTKKSELRIQLDIWVLVAVFHTLVALTDERAREMNRCFSRCCLRVSYKTSYLPSLLIQYSRFTSLSYCYCFKSSLLECAQCACTFCDGHNESRPNFTSPIDETCAKMTVGWLVFDPSTMIIDLMIFDSSTLIFVLCSARIRCSFTPAPRSSKCTLNRRSIARSRKSGR